CSEIRKAMDRNRYITYGGKGDGEKVRKSRSYKE
ncbi:unnamed protein product, partial [marine sediment metagenome]